MTKKIEQFIMNAFKLLMNEQSEKHFFNRQSDDVQSINILSWCNGYPKDSTGVKVRLFNGSTYKIEVTKMQ